MSRKEKYLEKIHAFFVEKGVEGWTVESLAKNIGVTKMTLYNNFKDKNEIVSLIMNYRSNSYRAFFNKLDGAKKNAIAELLMVLDFQQDSPLPQEKTFYQSFQKTYPGLYRRQQVKLRRMLRLFIIENYNRGVAEGIYREGINVQEIASYLISTMDHMFFRWLNEPIQLDLNKTHRHIISYHVRGIANEKGLKILEEELKKRPE